MKTHDVRTDAENVEHTTDHECNDDPVCGGPPSANPGADDSCVICGSPAGAFWGQGWSQPMCALCGEVEASSAFVWIARGEEMWLSKHRDRWFLFYCHRGVCTDCLAEEVLPPTAEELACFKAGTVRYRPLQPRGADVVVIPGVPSRPDDREPRKHL
jgi:hypothetical protein